MKYNLLQKYLFLFSIFCFVGIHAQNNFKLPKNAVFYMEVNGKQLNKKVNWAKFNPVFKEVLRKENKPNIWNDYSKTGIKYDDTQFHYFVYNDSVKAYSAHFILDDEQRFASFVNTAKKEGLEITKKNKYSYVSLDNSTFIAWNDKHAVLKMISYSRPYQYDEVDVTSVAVDSASYETDSVAVVPILPHIENNEIENSMEEEFDYKEEIVYLEEALEYNKESVKNSQEEIERIKKDILYLKKHHQYPKVKEELPSEKTLEKSEMETDTEMQDTKVESETDQESDDDYYKRMDSIDLAKYKIVQNLAEMSFDEIFNSNFFIEVPADKIQFKDAKADLFAYSNFSDIFNSNGYLGGMNSFGIVQGYLGKMYDSNSSYNLYFDDAEVKLVSNYKHNNPVVQKSIAEFYDGKSNKKLSKLISDKSVGYFAMNINGYKSFDAVYDLIENIAENQEYQKEISFFVETMKIALDEKEIAKILPGNAIFILNDVAYKKVEYTDYEYDEDYNESEIKKTKDAAVPDFTFAFVTENENYWKRFFEMVASNKDSKRHFVRKGEWYEFKDKSNKDIERILFGVKDGIVYLTTSEDNIGAKQQSKTTKKWSREVSKHSLSGWINAGKLVDSLEKEFTDNKEKEMYQFLRKNIGEMTYKTDVKSDNLETEMSYHINNSSENSLMYFFDLFDEIYKIMEPAEKFKKL